MQLDLFRDSKAEVIAFPTARRIALVRKTADELCALDYQDGRRFWSRHVRDLRRQLSSLYPDRRKVEAEITRYGEAVSREIYSRLNRRRTPDDAA